MTGLPEEQVIAIGLKKLRKYLRHLRQAPPAHEPTGREGVANDAAHEPFRRVVLLCTNLANYALLKRGAPVPHDGTQLFVALAQQGLLAASVADRLTGLTGLRAKLQHGHRELTAAEIAAWIPARLDELDAFAQAIAAVLEEPP
jgi:uncharacterized protein YutE (UPF0331/DUF86 family)